MYGHRTCRSRCLRRRCCPQFAEDPTPTETFDTPEDQESAAGNDKKK
jgi:hypothetical protein